MDQNIESAGNFQSPTEDSIENSMENLSVDDNSVEKSKSDFPLSKTSLQYDELFPALPSSNEGPTGTSLSGGLTTTASGAGASWSNAATARAEAMRIQSSVITQVFNVAQEERTKLDEGNHFGESASTSIITDITKKTGAHIEISTGKNQGLTVLVTGKSDAVAQARKLVLEKFQAQNSHTIKIPKEHHKFILGKKGKKLQELEQNTGTKIQVPPQNDPSDGVIISGSKESIERALHEIRVISDEQTKQCYEHIDIPKMYHPFITGKGNSKSNNLGNEYGVRINIPPVSTDKTEISIVGDKESVGKVKDILAKIHKDMERQCSTIGVEVNKAQHKYVIGAKGCNIAEILDLHGVSVEMPPQDSSSATITLRGPQEKLGAALTMVYDKASSMVHEEVQAPAWLHRYIIGRKGANINRVTAEFPSVHVEFVDKAEVIKFEGPKTEVEKAKMNLESMIKDIQSRLIQDEINVDSKYHKHIIGKAGANINRIRSETNVLVNIDQKGGNIIKLEGTPEGVKQVKQELQDLVKKMENEKERDVNIESRLHGNIIGTRGEKIKEIRDRFNQVQIIFPSASNKEDKVKVRGPKEDVDACCKCLLKLAKELMESNFQIKVPIFKQFMKFVIGKGGSNINKIRSETDTRIDLKENDQGSDDIIITGTKENCEKAKQLINKIQEEQANIVEMDIIVPSKIHNSLIGSKGRLVHSISEECGGVFIKFPKADKKSEKVTIRGPKEDVLKAKKLLVDLSNEKQISSFTEEISCKAQHHKFLIGKNGSYITELREKTGARIIFPTPKDDDKETITIIGKKEQVAAAKSMLEKKIKELDNISEATLTVAQKHHKHFVIRRAEVLRQIGEQFGGVSVSFPKNGSNSEQVTIKGPVECVAGAKARILEIVSELDSRTTITVVIPQRHHRTVMGQGGSSLQNITSQFNVEIKFPDRASREEMLRRKEEEEEENSSEVSPHDTVVIRGVASACEAAKQALLELVPIVQEVLVPFKYHRFVIGQRGEGVRGLMQKHRVNIQVPPAANQSDIIKITGSATDVEGAKTALEDLLAELEEKELDRQKRSYQVTLNVPSEYHPKIIGRRGTAVTKLRTQYGVNIQFPGKEDPDPTLITITGYEDKCEQAKEAILKITSDLNSMVKQTVHIDYRVHARLIGQRGLAIRKVMDQFKVSISFPRDGDDPDAVTINGPEEKVNDCQDHLLNLAEEYILDLEDREESNLYAANKPTPLQLGEALGVSSWADYDPSSQQVNNEGTVASGSNGAEDYSRGASKKQSMNGKGPVTNGVNKQGFVVSGAPWTQNPEAPNVNSSKDFPSMGGTSMPDVSSAWGPGRR